MGREGEEDQEHGGLDGGECLQNMADCRKSRMYSSKL